jgi:mycothiol synthase
MMSVEHQVEIANLGQRHSIDAVLRFVQPANDPFSLTLVDEQEIVWLTANALAAQPVDDGVKRVTCTRDGELVGYVAFDQSRADVAANPADLDACLAQLALLTDGPSRMWIRGVDPDNWESLSRYGIVKRRLAVCQRGLSAADEQPADRGGVTVRTFNPGHDDANVVNVLTRAYAGTPDGTWDAAQLQKRRSYPWFQASDLLLAQDRDGQLLGLHWLKRRDATTGEVYNLAVDPLHAGRGVGALLLAAGLWHLYANGMTHVVLWVDALNQPAISLYTNAGFLVHSLDVELLLAGS